MNVRCFIPTPSGVARAAPMRTGWAIVFGIAALVAAFVPIWTASAQGTGRRVIRLDAIKVEGRIQKPQAFYILQRSNLNFEGLELKQSFIPKIIESVNKDPF